MTFISQKKIVFNKEKHWQMWFSHLQSSRDTTVCFCCIFISGLYLILVEPAALLKNLASFERPACKTCKTRPYASARRLTESHPPLLPNLTPSFSSHSLDFNWKWECLQCLKWLQLSSHSPLYFHNQEAEGRGKTSRCGFLLCYLLCHPKVLDGLQMA